MTIEVSRVEPEVKPPLTKLKIVSDTFLNRTLEIMPKTANVLWFVQRDWEDRFPNSKAVVIRKEDLGLLIGHLQEIHDSW